MRSLTLRLNIVKELARGELTIEEFERILKESIAEEDLDKVKIMIADLVQVIDRRVTLSGEGRLLLKLISEQ